MNRIAVTVVIPMYNNQDTICETLDSVANQTIQNWEVICVDDGSTDDTVTVVRRYIAEHDQLQIKIIIRDSQNKGGSVCRNLGAKAANGDYLVFLDADDLLAETCLENRLKAIEKNKEIQFVVFPMASFTNDDLSTASIYSRLYVIEPLYYFVSGFGMWQVSSPIFRKDFFYLLQGFDESFPRMQDVEFHLRAVIESQGRYEIERGSDADCYYRKSNSVTITTEKLKRAIRGSELYISLIERYEENGVFSKRRKFFIALMSLFCHISMYQDMIALQERDFVRTRKLIESQLFTSLSKPTKMGIKLIEGIKNVKVRLQICRMVDKYLRTLLSK